MDQIGRYQLQAELGRGGFGRVYKAFDPTVGRTVAIKVLVSSGDADILTRFRNEAAATGKLRHRNIITIFDFGEQDGMPYLVMEYLEGQDLQNVAATGRTLTLLEKLSIMSQVADGLHHAHLNQIVHRDVKPANIMLLNDGTVKIMDFGIARLMSSSTTRLTQHGNLIGTISYIAPEQFMGNDVNELSDIFAYGTIFYELLTGIHPFKASDAPAIIYKITSVEPPPVSSIVPECPPGLEQIINRALQKKPEYRYQTLEDLQFDLAPIRLQLERYLAETLVQNARLAFEAGDMDRAQRITREALEHDANNSQARELREKIKRDAQIRVIRARSHSSVLAAKQDIEAGLHNRAVQTLEAAIRLDPENSEVLSLLNEANAALEKASRAANLLAQARRELEAQNLTNAYRNVVECLQNTPGSQEANELLGTIRKELDRRERERRFEEALAKVQSLIKDESHDEALGLLADLEADHPGAQRVKELLAAVHYARQEKERQRQFLADLNAAKGLIAKSHWNAAVDQLQRLSRQWPSQQEVKQLLQHALDQQTAQRQAEEVARIVTESTSLSAKHEFERALNLIEGGLRAWPSAEGLQRVLEQTKQARQSYERECAIQEEIRRIKEHVERKRFVEAAREVDAAIGTFRAPALSELKREVEREQQRHEREQTILTIKQNARQWLESGNFLDAVESLREAIAQYPEDTEFRGLLTQAEARLEERLKQDAIAAVITVAGAQLQKSEFDQALSGIAEALRRFPKEAQLTALLREAETAKLAFHRTRAETHWKEQRWNEALQAVESSLREYKNEPALLALQKSIKDDWERRQREAAIAGAMQEAQRLSSVGDNDGAIVVLEQAARAFPTEEPLARMLAEKKEQRAAAVRRQEIENLIREAAGLLDAQKFPKAIEVLQKGLTAYPSVPELSEWLDRARKADAEDTHRRAVQKVADAAATLLDKQQYDAAISTLDRHLKTYPNAPKLLELLKRTKDAKAEQERHQAQDKLIADAEALVGKRDFDSAIAALNRGLAANTGEPRLSSLLQRASQGKEEAERQRAVQLALERAAKLQTSEPEKAVQALDQALQKVPDHPDLLEAKATLQAQINKRNELNRLLAQARQWKDQKAFDRGLQALLDAEKVDPAAPEIATLRKQMEAARDEAAVNQIVAAASGLRSKGQLSEAVSELDDGLKLYPGSERLLDLRKQILSAVEVEERRQAAAAIATEAQRRLDRGELKEALELLEPAMRKYPEATGLSTLIAYVNETKAARERADEISRITREARSLVNAGKWTEAIAVLQPALQKFPNEEGIRSLLEKAGTEKAASERAQEIAKALSGAEAQSGQGRYAEAIALLQTALQRFPDEEGIRSLLEKLQAEKAAAERARALAEAEGHRSQGRYAEALQVLDEFLKSQGDDSAVRAAREEILAAGRAQVTTQALSEAAAHRAQDRFAEAVRILDEFLKKHGEDASVRAAREETVVAGRAQAVSQAISEAGAFRSQNRYSDALRVLDGFLKEYGDDPAVRTAREETLVASHAQAVSQVLSEAEAHRSKGRYPEALRVLDEFLKKNGEDAAVRTAREETLVASHAQAVSQVLSEAEAHRSKGRYPEALRVLDEFLKKNGEDAAVRTAREETLVASHAQAVSQVLSEAEAHRSKGRYPEALRVLDEFLKKNGEDAAVRAVRQEIAAAQSLHEREERAAAALTAARLSLGKGQTDAAIKVLRDALRRDADHPGLTAALAEAELAISQARQREEAIKQYVTAAEAAIARNQLQEAWGLVATGLSTHPNDDRLLKLKVRIDGLLRKAGLASLKQMAEEAKRAADVAALEQLSARMASVLNGLPVDGEIKTAQAKVQSEIKSRTAALNAKTKAPPVAAAASTPVIVQDPAAPTSSSPMPKYIGIAAGIVAVAFGGYYFLSGNKKAEVVDRPSQTQPNTSETPVVVAKVPAKLSISTNLETGTVTMDGKRVGSLQGGSFRLDSVDAGTHSVEISGSGGGEASFQFETQPGELPKLVGKVSAKELEALVVTNLGPKAEFAPSDASKPVTVAGQTVPAAGLNSLSAGAHEIKVGTASNAPVYLLNAGPSPAVTVFLQANRDTGTLLVETKQDGAAVFIDNRRYSRTTDQGVISIPLPARKYTVRVEKPGFHAPPPQLVEIAKSQVNRVGFTLVPQGGTLLISGALPGTSVKLDGDSKGAIQGNGAFPVAAGEHTVELSKDGYVTKLVRVTVGAGARAELGQSPVLVAKVVAPPPPVEAPKQQQPPPPANTTPADARDWEPLKDSRDVGALEAFRRKYPTGTYSDLAARRLEDIRKQQDEAARKQKEQSDAAAKLKEAERLKTAEAEKKTQDALAIRTAIDQYAKAFSSKKIEGLLAVWPGMPGPTQNTLKRTFKDVKSISLKLQPETVNVDGNSAVAICAREVTQVLDRPLTQSDKVTVRLRRADKSWVIESIQ